MGRFLRVIAWLTAFYALTPAWAVTQHDVTRAMARMQDWLYTQQHSENGAWVQARFHEPQAHQYGETALVVMALLRSGQVPLEQAGPPAPWRELSRPQRLAMAVDFLHAIGYEGFNGTHSVSLRMQCWNLLPRDWPHMRDADGRWLLRAHRESLFDYGPVRRERTDHSLTLFGVVGVWEFARRGGRVADRFWEDAMRHFIACQTPAGAWGYQPGDTEVRGSMTAAGLTVLLIARRALYRQRPAPHELGQAIDRAWQWLGEHFQGLDNPGFHLHHYYWLHVLQQACFLDGVRLLNGHDWFLSGARDILARQQADGSIGGSLVDTAFALAFLSSGQVPVWATRLKLPGGESTAGQDDVLALLTAFLSDTYEQPLTWQQVDLQEDLAHWRHVPVAWMTPGDSLHLDTSQQQRLREYMDMGGTLLIYPRANARAVIASVQALAAQWYPQWDFAPLTADHPLARGLHQVDLALAGQTLALSNGVRNLIVLCTRDIEARLRVETLTLDDDLLKLLANLYATTSGRGHLPGRLARPYESRRSDVQARGEVTVVQATLDTPGLIEPMAWRPMINILFHRTGRILKVETQPLERIATSDAALVHLAGVRAVALSTTQLQAIDAYLRGGGTLFIETIGGRGDFAAAVDRQLREHLGIEPVRLAEDDPIYSGAGLGLPGGRDALAYEPPARMALMAHHQPPGPDITYRPFTVAAEGAPARPRLAAYDLPGRVRPAVIVAHDDLSLGLLGVRHWEISGYSVDAARRIALHLLLMAEGRNEPRMNTDSH